VAAARGRRTPPRARRPCAATPGDVAAAVPLHADLDELASRHEERVRGARDEVSAGVLLEAVRPLPVDGAEREDAESPLPLRPLSARNWKRRRAVVPAQ
jgi:hypothetical protein